MNHLPRVLPRVRTVPQENPETEFTVADLRMLGELSIALGRLHWQEDVDVWSNQVAILVSQQEKLNHLVTNLLMRQL
jgi:hypothetical protein